MQSLYSYFQQDSADIVAHERDLFKSLDKIYDTTWNIIQTAKHKIYQPMLLLIK